MCPELWLFWRRKWWWTMRFWAYDWPSQWVILHVIEFNIIMNWLSFFEAPYLCVHFEFCSFWWAIKWSGMVCAPLLIRSHMDHMDIPNCGFPAVKPTYLFFGFWDRLVMWGNHQGFTKCWISAMMLRGRHLVLYCSQFATICSKSINSSVVSMLY